MIAAKRLKRQVLLIFGIFLLLYLILVFYVASFTGVTSSGNFPAVLVLGARSYKDGSYNPCLVSRVQEGVELYKKGKVTALIMSGGDDVEDGVNEAETMQKIASENGVPESAIILESNATSTYENFVYSRQLMEKNSISSIVVVTEPFHIGRARLIARSLGINAQYLAAQNSPCWTKWKYGSRYFLKEPFAILYYLLTGKIKINSF